VLFDIQNKLPEMLNDVKDLPHPTDVEGLLRLGRLKGGQRWNERARAMLPGTRRRRTTHHNARCARSYANANSFAMLCIGSMSRIDSGSRMKPWAA
jgi:hypothetical protein